MSYNKLSNLIYHEQVDIITTNIPWALSDGMLSSSGGKFKRKKKKEKDIVGWTDGTLEEASVQELEDMEHYTEAWVSRHRWMNRQSIF
jgi:hypothetical protein